ncbi:MAG: hypothetical protein ACKVOL_11665 [Novosphingobium sp.]
MNAQFTAQFLAKSIAKSLVGTMAVMLMAGPAFAAAQAVPAANPVSLKGDVKLEKSVTENGATRIQLLEPKVVVPGDHLVFTTRYQNDGAQAVTNFVVTNPLPSAVVLAPEAATGTEVSVDGGKNWGLLSTLKLADGKGGVRAALAGDVTHVRWTIAQIAPGAAGQVEYHAIVR